MNNNSLKSADGLFLKKVFENFEKIAYNDNKNFNNHLINGVCYSE